MVDENFPLRLNVDKRGLESSHRGLNLIGKRMIDVRKEMNLHTTNISISHGNRLINVAAFRKKSL